MRPGFVRSTLVLILSVTACAIVVAVGTSTAMSRITVLPERTTTTAPGPGTTAAPQGAAPSPAGIPVPAEYVALIQDGTTRCPAVPAQILAAQLWTESAFDPRAKSEAGAKGIAQFLPDTWREHGVDANGDGRTSVFDPADAIAAAAEYDCALLRYTRDVPGDAVVNMLAAYNAGPTAVRRANGIPPYAETQEYVDKVMDAAQRVTFP